MNSRLGAGKAAMGGRLGAENRKEATTVVCDKPDCILDALDIREAALGVYTPTQVFEHEVQTNSKNVLNAVEMEYSPMSNSGKSSTSPRWAGGGPSCSAAEPANL